jgi:hypothetical protein
VLKDTNGNWIRDFFHNLEITNSLAAELWGLRDLLLLARDLKICKLIVEIDAKFVVDLPKSESLGNTDSHPYSALINDCRYLILSFEAASLHHMHQESNFCADLLAKEGNKLLDSFSIYVFPPHFVVSQLLANIWRVSYPRLFIVNSFS